MEEIFLSRDKSDINDWLMRNGIIWDGCPRKFWLLTYFVILNLPNATARDRLDAKRYIYSQGGQIIENKLYHEKLFNPAYTLEARLILGK